MGRSLRFEDRERCRREEGFGFEVRVGEEEREFVEEGGEEVEDEGRRFSE